MIKIINAILNVVKTVMLLICFILTFYIIVRMYQRLDKNIADSIHNFIPFVLLFILFSVNFVLKQKVVNNNIIYNTTCCLVFGMLLFAIYRTFADNNMVIMKRLGYNINFNYFADMLAPMKAMLYGLSASNILLIASESRIFNVPEKPVIEKVKVEKPVVKVEKEVVKETKTVRKPRKTTKAKTVK